MNNSLLTTQTIDPPSNHLRKPVPFLLDTATICNILTMICESLWIPAAIIPAYLNQYSAHHSQYSVLSFSLTVWFWDTNASVLCISMQLFRFLATCSLRSPACCGERSHNIDRGMPVSHITVLTRRFCEQLCSFIPALRFYCCFALNSKI